MKLCELVRNLSFVVRSLAALLNVVNVCLWAVWGPGAVPPYTILAGPVLFLHALAGCLFVLTAVVLAQALGETPGSWAQRVFLLTGFIVLLPAGAIGIYVSIREGTAMQISVSTLCITVGLLLFADFVYTEKLYCCRKIES